MTTPTTANARPNPYVGPRSFKVGETLYGRERETSEIIDLLIAERIVLLYSPSGAGKSSLLNAAIFPAMSEQGFLVMPTMRVNAEPPPGALEDDAFNRYVYSLMLSLEGGQPEEARFPPQDLLGLTFAGYLGKFRQRAKTLEPAWDETTPLLLIFDQAEEVITLTPTDRDKKMQFFAQVGEVLRDRSIWALFAIREDYLASFDPYLRPIPTRLATRYRLNFLGADAALQAIREPSAQLGVDFAEEAAESLVNDLRQVLIQQPDGSSKYETGPYVEPVQLQVVCTRLWAQIPSSKADITLEDAKSTGSVNRALADYYAAQVAAVAAQAGATERSIREWFDRKLITVNNMRGQVLMSPEKSDGLDNTVIALLERTYLVRAEKRGGATWFELAHDRLVPPIRENNRDWFEENLSTLQRQADTWDRSGRLEGMLLFGPDYEAALAWGESNNAILTDVEREFLDSCKGLSERLAREQRRNRLVRRLLVIATGAFILVTVLALATGKLYDQANRSKRTAIAAQQTAVVARNNALQAQSDALTAKQSAVDARDLAVQAEHEAVARELGAAALNSLDKDSELSTWLVLDSEEVTGSLLSSNVQALHQILPSMRIERQMSGHQNKVYGVAFSPDGAHVASASRDGAVKVWDIVTGSTIANLNVLSNEDDKVAGVTKVVYSPDGRTLAATDSSGKVHFWQTSDWQELSTLQAHDDEVKALAYSPNGKYFATGGVDHTVKLWNAATRELLYTFGNANCKPRCGDGHLDAVNAVAFSNDSRLLASGSEDETAKIWSVDAGVFKYDLAGVNKHSRGVNGVAFSPDGKHLATASADRRIKIWDLVTRDVSVTIDRHVDRVNSLVYSPDGKVLYSASADNTARAWDTQYGREELDLRGHTGQVYDLALSPSGRYLATSSEDETVRLWDVSPAGSREVLTVDQFDSVYDANYSPDSSQFVTCGGNNVINIWDAKTGTRLQQSVGGHTQVAEGCIWDQSGKSIISVGRDGRVVIWDIASGSSRMPAEYDNVRLFAVDYDAKDNVFAVGGDDGLVHILEFPAGDEIGILDLHKLPDMDLASISSVAFSPDGKYLAVGSSDTPSVSVWDWKAGTPVAHHTLHTDFVEGVAFSPDGKLIASVSDDNTVRLWDFAQNEYYGPFLSHTGAVFDVTFGPDGKQFATAGADGLVKVWDASDLNNVHVIYDLYGNTNRVQSVAYNLDGMHVLSGGSDSTARIFTLDNDELVQIALTRLTRSMSEAECDKYNLGIYTQCPKTNWRTAQSTLNTDPNQPGSGSSSTLRENAPMFILNADTACRYAPGTDSNTKIAIGAGEPAQIIGKSPANNSGWWAVTYKNVSCWVGYSTGRVTGDLSNVPILFFLPAPAPTPQP